VDGMRVRDGVVGCENLEIQSLKGLKFVSCLYLEIENFQKAYYKFTHFD
jgi:hypothetical protein